MLNQHYKTVGKPVSEPISYEEAAQHLRVDSEDDKDYVIELITVAREYVEMITGMAGLQTRYLLTGRTWSDVGGSSIPIYRTPLQSVASVRYFPPGGTDLVQMDSTEFRVIDSQVPGQIEITGSMPALDARNDAVQIEFAAGYLTTDDIPSMYKHAMKFLLAQFYDNRGPVNIGNIVNTIPMTLEPLLVNLKIGGWMA